MSEKRIRDQMTVCGKAYADVKIFPVWETHRSRGAKRKPTTEIMEKLNADHADDHLRQLANTNFGAGDYSLSLTYAAAPDIEKAEENIRKLLRWLKYRFDKRHMELKAIWCTEQGSRNYRVHHHLILSGGISRDEIEALWEKIDGAGYANCDRLQFDETGIAALVHYINKRGQESYHKVGHTRNLEKPAVRQRDFSVTKTICSRIEEYEDYDRYLQDIAELREHPESQTVIDRLYPGWTLAEGVCIQNVVNKADYITLRLWKPEKSGGINNERNTKPSRGKNKG